MTTERDHGDFPPSMLQCQLEFRSVYSSLVLALRDMRTANGRDETTGAGLGNSSWIGLAIGMAVLDTLTGPGTKNVGAKWRRLLTEHGVNKSDADDIYLLRCSILHGYYIPKLSEGRRLQLVGDQHVHAVDTRIGNLVCVSVPVFCRCLVERIALEAQDDWDETLIDTDSADLRR